MSANTGNLLQLGLLLSLAVFNVGSNAQTPLGDDISLDFSDGAFDDSALFTEQSFSVSPFTFKLSQQTYGHVNRHELVNNPDGETRRSRGAELNRLGLLVKYQNAFAPGWLLQGSAQAKVYWPGDYEYEANDDRIDREFRVNELFVQRSGTRNSISFGRQTLVWGETIGNSVLDIINTTEFRDLTIIDIEDARLNQWLLVWDHFPGNNASNEHTGNSQNTGSWSTFLNLYPEFNPTPVSGSPLSFEPPFNLTDYRRNSPLLEAGTRWSRSFTGSDIAFMAAYLFENQLRFRPPASGQGNAVSEKNDFLLLGFSANRAIGRLLLTLDVAYSKNLLADTLVFAQTPGALPEADGVRKDQLGTSLGFEYAINNEQNLSISVLLERFLDRDDGLRATEVLLEPDTTGNILLRYSNNLANNNIQLAVTAQGDIEGDTMLLSTSVNFALNDRWAVTAQLIATRADANSSFNFLDEDVRLGAVISYSF
ncbi:MAG: hypothetical protein RQ757_08885 [Pseudomonadales bacterium]|nr:hypothetical protein [Pseudomonadales bacterium]